LHDAVLQHLMLGTRTHEEYIDEWVYNYGVWRRDLGEELWRERGKSSVDPRYFQFAMLRRIAARAVGVIVHNPGAAAMAREHGATRVFTIPHFFETEPAVTGDPDGVEFRERIGVSPDFTLFGIFGFMRETKRIPACLEAFRRLHSLRPRTALLLAGEVVSSDLARLLDAEPGGALGKPATTTGIYRIGNLSDADLNSAAAAVDCCLNLRYPAAGETSGIAIRLMGAGKPVVGSDNAENGDIPEAAMLRVKPGIAEVAELFEYMVLLTEYPGIARAVGEQARRHIGRCHGLETVVRQYWEALCDVTS
jgi:glycosyltransferase involved in cell wall biosynthesis